MDSEGAAKNGFCGCVGIALGVVALLLMLRACGVFGSDSADQQTVLATPVTATLEVAVSPTSPVTPRASRVPLSTRTPRPTATSMSAETLALDWGAAQVQKAKVLRNANIRSGPGVDFNVVDTATAGQEFDVYGEHEGWIQIDSSGSRWIGSTLVTLTGSDEVSAAEILLSPDEGSTAEDEVKLEFLILIEAYISATTNYFTLLGELGPDPASFDLEWIESVIASSATVKAIGSKIREHEPLDSYKEAYEITALATEHYDKGVDLILEGILQVDDSLVLQGAREFELGIALFEESKEKIPDRGQQ